MTDGAILSEKLAASLCQVRGSILSGTAR